MLDILDLPVLASPELGQSLLVGVVGPDIPLLGCLGVDLPVLVCLEFDVSSLAFLKVLVHSDSPQPPIFSELVRLTSS